MTLALALALSPLLLASAPASPPPPTEVEVEVAVTSPAAMADGTDSPAADAPADAPAELDPAPELPAPAPLPEDLPDFELDPLPPEPTSPIPAERHLAVANFYGLTAGVSYLPSIDQTLFLGRARAHRPGRARRALGYSFTLSVGAADRYFTSLLTTRHHITAMFYAGKRERLFTAIGGGVALHYLIIPSVLEAEGRVGYVFGKNRDRRRAAGVVGAVARLGWNVRHGEYAPMPQVGLFIGLLAR